MAPLSRPATLSSTVSRAVSTITGRFGRSRRMLRSTVSPSRPGSIMSRITRSRSAASACRSPSMPSAAQTTAYPSASRPRWTKSAMALSSSTTRMRIYRTMLGGQGVDGPAALDHVTRWEGRRRRAALDRSGARVRDAAVARADDLTALVADGAAGVGADGAERGQRAVALTDDDVRLLVAGVRVGGGLPAWQLVRRADAYRPGRYATGRRHRGLRRPKRFL